MIAGSTIFIFRRRKADAPSPYRVWGYPWVPILFVVASAILLYYTFTDNVKNSALGIALILSGVPFFAFLTAGHPLKPRSSARISRSALGIIAITKVHQRRARLPRIPILPYFKHSTRCTLPTVGFPVWSKKHNGYG